MADNTHDRSLVTFALFAYNQEKYIREALEGAFAQTYEPLEIILSDDFSSDGTFEIMLEMASKYDGPHKIIKRQNKTNMGTLLHVKKVTECMSGSLIVFAAGDDISYPNRVEKIYDTWKESGSWGIFSDFSEIDQYGLITSSHKKNYYIASPSYKLKAYMLGNVKVNSITHGATSAYDSMLFDYLSKTDNNYILSEDGALSVLLHILGKTVSYLEEPLVKYRSHDESLTNATGRRLSWAQLLNAEKKIAKFALSQSNRCLFFIECNKKFNNHSQVRVDVELLQKDYESHLIIANWWGLPLAERIVNLLKTKGAARRWMLPRLLPRKLFLFGKYLRDLLYRR
ncbi:glycosyltransferase [Yoonia sp.]|nr:glycosyltransferase [Yoonia sp.]MDB4240813.1 glycosyltransferase [Yoonia sp.]